MFTWNHGDFVLPIRLDKNAPFALIAEKEGELFFGCHNIADEAICKWRLLSFIKESQDRARAESDDFLNQTQETKTESPEIAKEEREGTEVKQGIEGEDASAETPIETDPVLSENRTQADSESEFDPSEAPNADEKIEKAKERIQNGEPCPFLEEAIQGSKWAKMQEDGEVFYLGLMSGEDGEKLFYAAEGLRDAPEIENAAFFPSPEDEEIGWFIKEI